MRRQDQLDSQTFDVPAKGVRRDASPPQPGKHLLARARLRPMRGIARIIAATPDAMVLFGDVRERQEVGERAGDRNGRRERQVPEQFRELREVGVVAAPGAL